MSASVRPGRPTPAAPAPATRGGTWHVLVRGYLPAVGGVAEYASNVARGLAERGEQVHLWCDAADGSARVDRADSAAGVHVHRLLGDAGPGALARVGREAGKVPGKRRWLLHWVPHQYGWMTMNVWICAWLLWRRRVRRDHVEIIVHEAALAFLPGRWRQNAAAAVHRLMLMLLMRAADHVYLSTPAWAPLLRRMAPRRAPRIHWLPIPSNTPVVEDAAAARRARERWAPDARVVVGHFGTGGGPVGELFDTVLPALHRRVPDATVLLFGANSDVLRDRVVGRRPELAGFVMATGRLDARDVSLAVQACDVLLQPYPDGVTTRRTSTMVALAHGRAVVTSDGPLTEPLWRDGSVRLVPPTDAAATADAVAALLEDAGERARVAERGRALYEERFALARTIDALQVGAGTPA